jgi:hypothetical protein
MGSDFTELRVKLQDYYVFEYPEWIDDISYSLPYPTIVFLVLEPQIYEKRQITVVVVIDETVFDSFNKNYIGSIYSISVPRDYLEGTHKRIRNDYVRNVRMISDSRKHKRRNLSRHR